MGGETQLTMALHVDRTVLNLSSVGPEGIVLGLQTPEAELQSEPADIALAYLEPSLPIAAQREHLAKVIRGHCAYYGLTGNGKRLEWFRYQVTHIWRTWLARRSRLRRLNPHFPGELRGWTL